MLDNAVARITHLYVVDHSCEVFERKVHIKLDKLAIIFIGDIVE